MNGKSNGGPSAGAEWESDFREHFLYFPDKAAADKAAARLRAKGWSVEVERAVVRKDWLVLATDHWPNEEEFESQWQELHRLAEELGGEYDGYGGPG